MRATFEQRLTLHSSAAWLSVPDTLLLTHNGRGFGIRAELAQVPPGSLHYAEVVARSAGADAVLGECFRVPVTLVCTTCCMNCVVGRRTYRCPGATAGAISRKGPVLWNGLFRVLEGQAPWEGSVGRDDTNDFLDCVIGLDYHCL